MLGEGETMLEVEPDAWKVGVGVMTPCLPVTPPRLELEGIPFENACSMSLSYTKLSVAGKKGASPEAILRM